MAPCALLLRCIDILYLLNLPDSVLRLLAGLFGLAVRTTIVVLTIYDFLVEAVAAVAEFMWSPYQFLWEPNSPYWHEAIMPDGSGWLYTPMVTLVAAALIDMVCVLVRARCWAAPCTISLTRGRLGWAVY